MCEHEVVLYLGIKGVEVGICGSRHCLDKASMECLSAMFSASKYL